MANFHGFVLFCLCFAMLMATVSSTQYKVGGSMGWGVPTGPNAVSYNQWAERIRFQIGDSLLFVYLPDKDPVLLVDSDAYKSCNTSSFIDEFDDGNTVFTFSRSGPFYFISGIKENCLKNASMAVVVMADRRGSSNIAPSPSPLSATSPPPPPSDNLEFSPTSNSPTLPTNAASSKVVALMGTIGGFIVSLFLL